MRNLLGFLGDKKKRRRLTISCLGLLNFLVWFAFFSFPAQKLYIWFLDVGQGDAVLIRTAQRNTILIDGGPSDRVLTKIGEHCPYWEHSLDLLIISHWDADHITGLVEVLKSYDVKNIVYPVFECDSMICGKVKELVNNEAARIIEAEVGGSIRFGTTLFDIVWPAASCDLGSNDCSAVVLLDWGEFEVLFSGDIEENGQRAVLNNLPTVNAEVLKVPHHGADCLSEGFLTFLSPIVSVISVGKNSYGHPTVATLDKLEKVGSLIFRTDQDGTVEIMADEDNWQVH